VFSQHNCKKIKTIPGGYFVIIIRLFIGLVASWFLCDKRSTIKDTREHTLQNKAQKSLVSHLLNKTIFIRT